MESFLNGFQPWPWIYLLVYYIILFKLFLQRVIVSCSTSPLRSLYIKAFFPSLSSPLVSLCIQAFLVFFCLHSLLFVSKYKHFQFFFLLYSLLFVSKYKNFQFFFLYSLLFVLSQYKHRVQFYPSSFFSFTFWKCNFPFDPSPFAWLVGVIGKSAIIS